MLTRGEVHAVFAYCKEHYDSFVGFDYETNGLDELDNQPLLLAIGCAEKYAVIDVTKQQPLDLFPDDYQDYTYIGHNIKFDMGFARVHHRLNLKKVWCTMVASQKLTQNLGLTHSLNVVYFRYGYKENKQEYVEFNKHIRDSFINQPTHTFVPTKQQVDYAANDIRYLYPTMVGQMRELVANDQFWFVANVEMPLVRVLSKIETTGFPVDYDGLMSLIKENKNTAYETALRLDEEVRSLASSLLQGTEKAQFTGKFSRKRNKIEIPMQYDLFGNELGYDKIAVYSRGSKSKGTTKIVEVKNANLGNTNYNSDHEIIDIFARLKQPMLTSDDIYLIPCFNEEGKIVVRGVGMDGSGNKMACGAFLVNKVAFSKYLVDYPNTPMRTFIQLLQEYRRADHEVSAFGKNFLDKIYEINGYKRLFTFYRQTNTANGRLASGGGRGRPKRYNSQNLPRNNKVRNLFVARENCHIVTTDLSGAEVTIMADQAEDYTLFNWAVKNDDAHSPIVQNSWRAIFTYRAGELAGVWRTYKEYAWYKKDKKALMIQFQNQFPYGHSVHMNAIDALCFTVSKKENAGYRQGGKNCTFGSVYGMSPAKAMETYNGTTAELRKRDPKAKPVNVSLEEAKAALNAIKKAIPKTFEYVESNVTKAIQQGYLVLNERSKSRVWFRSALYALQQVFEMQKEIAQESAIDPDTGELIPGIYPDAEFDNASSSWVFLDGNGKPTEDTVQFNWKELEEIAGQARNIPISGTQADMLKEAMVVIDDIIESQGLDAELRMQVHDELVYDAPIDLMVTYKGKEIPFTELPAKVMVEVANKYLNNFQMKADTTVMRCWTK
jgi:DNA polymerase I-like protein with 3'-5' exonuclease and polymerase domains